MFVFPVLPARDRNEKPFAVSYIKLMNDDGTTLSDAIHDLLVYRVSPCQLLLMFILLLFLLLCSAVQRSVL